MSKPTGNGGHGTDQGKRTALACPHCRAATRVVTSRSVTALYRQYYFRCFNPECGFTFAADLTVTHAVSPSARPNPAVQLRQAPPRRRPTPANDELPARCTLPAGPEVPAANDGVAAATG